MIFAACNSSKALSNGSASNDTKNRRRDGTHHLEQHEPLFLRQPSELELYMGLYYAGLRINPELPPH
ncbi:MAG TPA: hypothetical protein VFJ51_10080 [Nitrososphaeraceae archaeon]|nr:hypothetical protein [Nitrososphaeraceae archaeon]